MPELDELFISPHAVEQFQQRIALMSEARSRFFIGEGIRQSVNVKLLPDGGTLRIRTRRPFPFEFRAFVVFDRMRHNWVVTTVVRGDSNVTRKQRRKTPSPENPALVP
ncbi:MAG TPA: hypothetical protein VJ464_00225 [Blastocatellia bacterium]|nr:hypothetical protein [Blastocatellia bacterium]